MAVDPSRAGGDLGGDSRFPAPPARAVVLPQKQCEEPSLGDRGEQSGALPRPGVCAALLCPVLPLSMDFFEHQLSVYPPLKLFWLPPLGKGLVNAVWEMLLWFYRVFMLCE